MSARRSRHGQAAEGFGVYLGVFLLASRGPNPLIVYADDLGLAQAVGLLFLGPPLLVWLAWLIRTSNQSRRLVLVAVCAGLACQSLSSLLYAGALRAGGGTPSASRQLEEPLQVIDLIKHGGVSIGSWVTEVDRLPNGARLLHAHRASHGSGSNQSEVLISVRADGTVIDWNSYAHSGNHPTCSETDWILPVSIQPFARRQFWIQRSQYERTTRLFEVMADGRFSYYDPTWAAVPWLLSLLPLAALLLFRKRPKQAYIVALGLLFAWCLAYAPWRAWGLAY